ncbi:MAG: bacillithiol system protein YtxJ [Bacteroidetes bacterium OLB11]|nr:MAG: bacillithiol system protein YtxJ [Bacteroidetes bacterium OLB11]
MESGTTELGVDCYYLDLLKHRDISNQIAEHYQVEHQSPQILIIRNGQCQYSDTHMNITFEDVKKELVELA